MVQRARPQLCPWTLVLPCPFSFGYFNFLKNSNIYFPSFFLLYFKIILTFSIIIPVFGARSSEFAGEIDKSKATSVFVGRIGQPRWAEPPGVPGNGGSSGGSVLASLCHPPRSRGWGQRGPEPMATLLFPCPWKLPTGLVQLKRNRRNYGSCSRESPGQNVSALHTARGINSFTFSFI